MDRVIDLPGMKLTVRMNNTNRGLHPSFIEKYYNHAMKKALDGAIKEGTDATSKEKLIMRLRKKLAEKKK